FYQAVLGAVGYEKLVVRPRTIGFGKAYPEFWLNLRATMSPINGDCGAHVGLRVRTIELVDAFHSPPLPDGGRSDGGPGLRPQHGEGYYAAFLRDPDGNRIEAVTFLKAQEGCPAWRYIRPAATDVIFFSASETERAASHSFGKISSTCSATTRLTGGPSP